MSVLVFTSWYWSSLRFLRGPFLFFCQILGRFGVLHDKVGYSFSFEVGLSGVVDSGVVSVGSSESLSCEA